MEGMDGSGIKIRYIKCISSETEGERDRKKGRKQKKMEKLQLQHYPPLSVAVWTLLLPLNVNVRDYINLWFVGGDVVAATVSHVHNRRRRCRLRSAQLSLFYYSPKRAKTKRASRGRKKKLEVKRKRWRDNGARPKWSEKIGTAKDMALHAQSGKSASDQQIYDRRDFSHAGCGCDQATAVDCCCCCRRCLVVYCF